MIHQKLETLARGSRSVREKVRRRRVINHLFVRHSQPKAEVERLVDKFGERGAELILETEAKNRCGIQKATDLVIAERIRAQREK